MFLKRFSVNKKEPLKETPIQLQRTPEWSVPYYQYPRDANELAQDHFDPRNDNCPHFKLGQHELSIEWRRGNAVCARNPVKDKHGFVSYIHGYSKHSPIKVIQHCPITIPDMNDILILGTLCEAVCKASISIKVLTENVELVEQFVKESLKYIKCPDSEYEFVLNRALELLDKEPVRLPEHPLKAMILFGNTTSGTVVLDIFSTRIRISNEELTESEIIIPYIYGIPKDFYRTYMDFIVDALVWTLLAKEGFYLDSDGYFCRFTPPSTYNLTPKSFYNHTIFDPYHTLEIFTDKQ